MESPGVSKTWIERWSEELGAAVRRLEAMPERLPELVVLETTPAGRRLTARETGSRRWRSPARLRWPSD